MGHGVYPASPVTSTFILTPLLTLHKPDYGNQRNNSNQPSPNIPRIFRNQEAVEELSRKRRCRGGDG